MFEEIEAIVSGHVQAVMYRDFTQSVAVTLGLLGFVENRDDGTVRVVAQGTPEALRHFVERLNEGSVLARVEHVAVTWRSPSERFTDFYISHNK